MVGKKKESSVQGATLIESRSLLDIRKELDTDWAKYQDAMGITQALKHMLKRSLEEVRIMFWTEKDPQIPPWQEDRKKAKHIESLKMQLREARKEMKMAECTSNDLKEEIGSVGRAMKKREMKMDNLREKARQQKQHVKDLRTKDVKETQRFSEAEAKVNNLQTEIRNLGRRMQ